MYGRVPDQCLYAKSNDWAFAVRNREDLLWAEALASKPAQELTKNIQRCFGRSLHIRHVDAGSCNGCESELQALNNPYYNLHRLGIFFHAVAKIRRLAARYRIGHLRHARGIARNLPCNAGAALGNGYGHLRGFRRRHRGRI